MQTKNIALIGGTLVVIVTTISYLSYSRIKATETIHTKKAQPTETVAKPQTKQYTNTLMPAAKKAVVSKKYISAKKKVVALPEKKVVPLVKENKLFSPDYLKTQEFVIDIKRDTQLLAEGGMKLSIPAQAFAFKNGKQAEGKITIQVKEAFTPQDIVMANLVTKKGKELLESGGMYYLNAKSEEQDLAVAAGKTLTVEVPTTSREKGMELYEGKQSKGGLDWANPVVLNKQEQELDIATKEAAELFDIKVEAKANRVVKAAGNNNVKKDSLGWIRREGPVNGLNGVFGNFNMGAEDKSLSYVTNTNRLGWANIDRLYSDPRSRRISFVTEVEKSAEFEKVYISMMFKSKRIYLPGYKKADGTYSFTHGDYEEPVLPVGEKAVIMVSAYKNGEQYFAIQQITIDDNLNINLQPQLMAAEQIKAEVNKSL